MLSFDGLEPSAHPNSRAEAEDVTVDEVDFKSLYKKSQYEVTTADRWTLVVTRYRPVEQPFEQPIFGEPILLVHGFSQNRHAWTSGQFVKNLLFFGADIHVLELRGHGKSSVALQREKAAQGQKPPDDLEYGWDIDSYFLYDLPAAVEGVRKVTRRDKIFYIGHSMGGMLGYGYAGIHDDLEGLVTIGAPAQLGAGFPLLRLAALAEPMLGRAVDAALAGLTLQRAAAWRAEQGTRAALSLLRLSSFAERHLPSRLAPAALRYSFVPMDELLKLVERMLTPENFAHYTKLSPLLTVLTNPARVTNEDVRWLLRNGGEKEPRGVVEQFARWIRRGEMVCYRTGYDFRRNFAKIDIPMAIIFGDLDRLASVKSTAPIYRAAKSEYLLWRPVKGNSHIELTMGHDIRQIAYDVKNLIDYARKHRGKKPSLPRLARAPRR